MTALAQQPTNTICIKAGSTDTSITITDSEIQLRVDGQAILEAKKDGRLLVRGVDVDNDASVYSAFKQWFRSAVAPASAPLAAVRPLRLVVDPPL